MGGAVASVSCVVGMLWVSAVPSSLHANRAAAARTAGANHSRLLWMIGFMSLSPGRRTVEANVRSGGAAAIGQLAHREATR